MSNIGFLAQQVTRPWLPLSIGARHFLVGLDAFAMDAPVLLLILPGVLMTSIGLIGCYTANAASCLPFTFVALWVLPRHGSVVVTRSAFDVPHLFKGIRRIAQDATMRWVLWTVLIISVLYGPGATFCPVLLLLAGLCMSVGSTSANT